MIQRINFAAPAAYQTKIKRNASQPVESVAAQSIQTQQSNVSFKGFWADIFGGDNGGDVLYDDTLALVNKARENLLALGKKKGTTLCEDGTLIRYEVLKRGISVDLDNPSKSFKEKYGYNRLGIMTDEEAVTWYTPTASFMINELDRGTVDKPLREYLPALCKLRV